MLQVLILPAVRPFVYRKTPENDEICGIKAIQVKTTTGDSYAAQGLSNRRYHLLAVVRLRTSNGDVSLDESEVFLIPKDEVSKAPRNCDMLGSYRLTMPHLDRLFHS